MSDILTMARRYVAAGLSVIPVRADGSKAPALKAGDVEQYRDRFATLAELETWFAPQRAVGVAIVCGKISGNLAVLDFESNTAWERWRELLANSGRGGLLAPLPIVQTPKGGRHVYCRITEGAVAGSKLAMRSKSETLVEVRGQGHYVLAPGCPVACHELNRPYTFESEGWLAQSL